MDSTAPAKAPRPAPRRTPLSEARPANAPVNAPVRPPAATGKPNPRQRKKKQSTQTKTQKQHKVLSTLWGRGGALTNGEDAGEGPREDAGDQPGEARPRRYASALPFRRRWQWRHFHDSASRRKLTRSRSSVTVDRVGLGLTQGPVYLMAPARLVDWWLVGTPVVEELAGRREGRRGRGDRRERVTPPDNDLPLGSGCVAGLQFAAALTISKAFRACFPSRVYVLRKLPQNIWRARAGCTKSLNLHATGMYKQVRFFLKRKKRSSS